MGDSEDGGNMHVFVHVHDKIFSISAGDGSQRVKWLGHVAIARWDEDHNQGWRRLGIPTAIEMIEGGFEIDMAAIIKNVIQNNEHIKVLTSLDPSETR
jgi:hypothetical protein